MRDGEEDVDEPEGHEDPEGDPLEDGRPSELEADHLSPEDQEAEADGRGGAEDTHRVGEIARGNCKADGRGWGAPK